MKVKGGVLKPTLRVQPKARLQVANSSAPHRNKSTSPRQKQELDYGKKFGSSLPVESVLKLGRIIGLSSTEDEFT